MSASGISFFRSLAGGTTPFSFCRNDFLVGSADEDASPIFFPLPCAKPLKLPGIDIEIDVGVRWSVANDRVRKGDVKAKVEFTNIMIMDAFATIKRFVIFEFLFNQLECKILVFTDFS